MKKQLLSILLFLSFIGISNADAIYKGTHNFAVSNATVIISDAANSNSPVTLNQFQTMNSYPVFMIPLGANWTDFELKASTNNFTTLLYFIHSDQATTNTTTDDADVYIYFTDDYATDPRKWNKSLFQTPIWSQLVDPVNSMVEYVIVCPSHNMGTGGTIFPVWMSPTNSNLVWSFNRRDVGGLQMNATGTNSRWIPIVPIEWRKLRIIP